MDLAKGIKTPEQCREVVQMALKKEVGKRFDEVWALHKYKWYNWYLNMHIKPDTPQDVENTKIFEEIKDKYPELHNEIEENIKYEVEKLNRPIEEDF